VVGLGNPGQRYRLTRHNIGFMVVDVLAQQTGIKISQYKCHAVFGKGRLGNVPVVLAKPLTYMNESGIAVAELLNRFKVSATTAIIISDDFHLPLGKIRIRRLGSSGGHHGLESIIEKLGTAEFIRVRIGIGEPVENDVVEFVLSEFTDDEIEQIESSVVQSAESVSVIIEQGITQAMNQFNTIRNSKG